MKTLSRICTVLMVAGAASLMAADGDTGTTLNTSGGKVSTRMRERGEHGPRGERGPRGEHGPRGGHGKFSMLICPNCHHRLIVLSPEGHGGRHGERDGRNWRGGRGMKRGQRPSRPAEKPAETSAETK